MLVKPIGFRRTSHPYIRLVQYKLKLGGYYMLGCWNKTPYKLIQVTPKGFNFIADDGLRTKYNRARWGQFVDEDNTVRISMGSAIKLYELVNYEVL